jgi:phosphoenolpyruvate mutase
VSDARARLSDPGTEAPGGLRATGLPADRLPMIKTMLKTLKRPLRIMETHSGLTGMIAENVRVTKEDGEVVGYDGMWSSSLTASCLKGKPDIELVDTTARCQIVADTLAVTTLPMIYDADTGGQPEIFKFTVRTLEEMGVSACIIEDKTGLKQNSLFGTERTQVLDDIPSFCAKIAAGREARRTEDFMVIARIEALIAGFGMEEALKRAAAYSDAGADAIMIHSREKSPEEILTFCQLYRDALGASAKPIVVVPSSYNVIYESELQAAGVSIIIYANHMLRSSYPAMLSVAEQILKNGRSKEVDSSMLPIKHVISMIDEDPARRAEGLKKRKGTAPAEPAAKKPKPDGGDDAKAAAPAPPKASATKVEPREFLRHMHDLGIKFFAGVPDSCIATFCAELDAPVEGTRHVITANEGASIGMAFGHHMATGEVPLVYMQASRLSHGPRPRACHAHPVPRPTPTPRHARPDRHRSFLLPRPHPPTHSSLPPARAHPRTHRRLTIALSFRSIAELGPRQRGQPAPLRRPP